jgi:hypothetical protein
MCCLEVMEGFTVGALKVPLRDLHAIWLDGLLFFFTP